MSYPFHQMQRFVASIHGHKNRELREAIQHHCALYIASNTAPTEAETSRFSGLEVKAKNRMLKMPVATLEDLRLKGRYLRLLSDRDEWERDAGTIDALLAGMSGAA